MIQPTLLHITHWKAGSQWIKKGLFSLYSNRIVTELPDNAEFLTQPVVPGAVFTPLYISKWQYDSVQVPEGTARFVVIRDLRDTLVSMYFSFKGPHPENSESAKTTKAVLNSVSDESGYIYLIHEVLEYSALIQRSWLEAGERLFRYEDLLGDDLGTFREILVNHCGLDVETEHLDSAVRGHRFEKIVNRPRGTEDRTAHERKGIAGDWRNHFTERIKVAFKDVYGKLLIQTGYERDANW